MEQQLAAAICSNSRLPVIDMIDRRASEAHETGVADVVCRHNSHDQSFHHAATAHLIARWPCVALA